MLLFIFCSRRTWVSAKPFSWDWSEMTQAKPRSDSWTSSNLTLVDASELRGHCWKFSSERVSVVNSYLEGSSTEISRILSQMLIWNSEITVFLRCLMQGACSGSKQLPCTMVTCLCWLLLRENWGQNRSTRASPVKSCRQSFLDLFGHCFWLSQDTADGAFTMGIVVETSEYCNP